MLFRNPSTMLPSSTPQLDEVIDNAVKWSFQHQHVDGSWMARLETNCCMDAQWVLTMHFLGVLQDNPIKNGLMRSILSSQKADGSWVMFHDAPMGDINITTECYVALKAMGLRADEHAMVVARKWIFEHGGLRVTRMFTKIWLALVGELSWDDIPCIPPELIFLPHYFPLHIYNLSNWARPTFVALSILSARRAVHPLPPDCCCHELKESRGKNETTNGFLSRPPTTNRSLWHKFFKCVDKLLLWYGKSHFIAKLGRETAIDCCVAWIVKHQAPEGSFMGIQLPWVLSLMALRCEGYPLEHPVLRSGLHAAFNHPWAIETDQGTLIQASVSIIWDTLLTQTALLDCGISVTHPQFTKSLNYILSQQVTTVKGDWSMKVPNTKPGGWCFEHDNDGSPDVDDTAVAVMVLARSLQAGTSTIRESHDENTTGESCEHFRHKISTALDRGLEWMMAMACSNGAWAAFDKDNTSFITCMLPFCDYGEVIDPPSVDVTAHVLQALGTLGLHLKEDARIAKAVRWIRSEQESDGSWFGRWGVNYIYGVGAVLPALRAVGEDMDASYVRKAVRWLVLHQNEDGGWGEVCTSYVDPTLHGHGPSTPSQTAWALLGLLAAQPHHGGHIGPELDPINKGVVYLMRMQGKDGSWEEDHFTGTGFPGYLGGARHSLVSNQGKDLHRMFMMKYHMYRHYFPLMALGQVRQYYQDISYTLPCCRS